MATANKTIAFHFPILNSAAEITDTNFTAITAYLPESGKTFRSVKLEVWYHDVSTAFGSMTRRQLSLQLAAVAYSVVNNATTITTTGEQFIFQAAADFTSYFTTNWSGTSMTVNARFLGDNSTGTPLGYRNLFAKLTINYDYDDTSTTQIKRVWIPLNMPVGASGIVKPGSPTATIPALDTHLPEFSKVYRQTTVVVQGNMANTANTDSTLSQEVDTAGVVTTQLYEQGGIQAMFTYWCHTHSFTTNVTHSWYFWGSVNVNNHMQAWLEVVYEFDASNSADVFNSLMLPFDMGHGGGTGAGDYQRASVDLMIAEPATITSRELSAYLFWMSQGLTSGLNARLGSGSFVTYTDLAAINAGSSALMIRNDAAYTLVRGRNTLVVDLYSTDNTDFLMPLSGFLIVNYQSGKASGGHGVHNRSSQRNLTNHSTIAAQSRLQIASAVGAFMPETSIYLNSIGIENIWTQSNALNTGLDIRAERLSSGGEGGTAWEKLLGGAVNFDQEVGVFKWYSKDKDIFLSHTGDPRVGRLDPEVSRRWMFISGNAQGVFWDVNMLYTYHAITFTAAGTITGSAGGTVNLYLMRIKGNGDHERVLSTSRVGDGAFSFTWFDNVELCYVVAYESSSKKGVSAQQIAGGSAYDINLSAASAASYPFVG